MVNDADCQNVVLICSAGNSNGKQEIKDGTDYSNQFTSGTFYYGSGYDAYYNRSGTPAITREGEDDAVIKVASIDSSRQSGSQERTSSFSDRGPNIDIWAAGSTVLSPWSSGYQDPRNSSYYNQLLEWNKYGIAKCDCCRCTTSRVKSNCYEKKCKKMVIVRGI